MEIQIKDCPMDVIKVKKTNVNAILPTRGDSEAAGIDLYACLAQPVTIAPHTSSPIFDSGIAFELPPGMFGMVVPRSSVGIKRHLRLSNSVGIIDNSYRASVKFSFFNDGDTAETIQHGERIAQMVLLPYVTYPVVEVEELSETERGEGGIGSTGR